MGELIVVVVGIVQDRCAIFFLPCSISLPQFALLSLIPSLLLYRIYLDAPSTHNSLVGSTLLHMVIRN